MFNDKKKKIFSNQLEPISNRVIIGGLEEDEFLNLPTKELILQERQAEAEAEVQQYVNDTLVQAKQEAEAMIAKAKAEEQAIRDNAYNEGFQKGEQEGRVAIENEYRILLEDAQNIIQAIEHEKREALEEEEEAMLEFIFKIAKKIIVKDLSFDKEPLLDLLRKSINYLDFKQEILVSLPSESAKALNDFKAEFTAEFPDLESLTITADQSLDNGDLIVESKKQRLDLRLDAQMETLLNDLKHIRKYSKTVSEAKTEDKQDELEVQVNNKDSQQNIISENITEIDINSNEESVTSEDLDDMGDFSSLMEGLDIDLNNDET
ncbi:MAG: hypothetical protein MK033_03735 [Candidatus Caenarcaniphilales bacterium]|nr:hypothetical protein [Candidatus Caenarcaniphilales bacterium]